MDVTTTQGAAATGGIMGFLAAMGIVFMICLIAYYVLMVIAYWKIFKKAGKAGWRSIIPFLNTYDIYEIAWSKKMAAINLVLFVVTIILNAINTNINNGILGVIITILAIALIVIGIIYCFKLSKAFGHGIGFGFGILFLSTIFYLILGFGKSEYVGNDDTNSPAV